MAPSDIFVWVQTTRKRDAQPTLDSIEASDIGTRYHVCEDPQPRVTLEDYVSLQQWWMDASLEMADRAERAGYSWILRLEDDILVNEHILHNATSWAAPRDPRFGYGTFFTPDRWLTRPKSFALGASGELYCTQKDVAGGQAQLYSVERIRSLIPLVPEMKRLRGLDKPQHGPSFDWALSRAAYYYGRRTHGLPPLHVFVHRPALVNLRDTSRLSSLSPNPTLQPETLHYWGNKSFDATWRRPSNAPAVS